MVSRSRFAIVVARFYEEIGERLVRGAQRAFADAGVGEADVYEVPGSFELPLAALYLAESGYEGVACVGTVVRGETDHYDYVCTEAARGIQDVNLRTGVPCSFGLLTVNTVEQAIARSGGDERDQGCAAAVAVIELAQLKSRLNALSS